MPELRERANARAGREKEIVPGLDDRVCQGWTNERGSERESRQPVRALFMDATVVMYPLFVS